MQGRVLVVDDDGLVRQLLRIHLESAGYEVALAQDAIAAGHVLLKQPPDLVISDVSMPYMDGIEFFATVIADQTLPTIPFVFLSSDNAREDHARMLGAAEYLLKPVLKDRLLETVGRALNGTRAARTGTARPCTSRGRT